MCGLIGGTGHVESRYLVALGCLAEDRGSDSAGVAWQVGDKLRTAKVAKNPLVAYPVDLAPALRHAAKYKAPVIGHTRQATQGAITARNAHPFLDAESKIAWAHNGVIINDKEFGTFEVDSECLIQGIKKRDFSPFHGSIALLWIEGGKLHAFRKSNPLHRGIKKGAVYLASEAGMLTAIGCHRIKELSEGFIYVFNGNVLEETRKVPFHQYAKQGAWNGERWEEDAAAYRGCGYRYDERPGPEYLWWHTSDWHNHSATISWDSACKTCNPSGRAAPNKTDVEESGQPSEPQMTELMPIKKAGSLAESYVEKIESEEAERMNAIMDEESLCHICKKAPRMRESEKCNGCMLSIWRNQ